MPTFSLILRVKRDILRLWSRNFYYQVSLIFDELGLWTHKWNKTKIKITSLTSKQDLSRILKIFKNETLISVKYFQHCLHTRIFLESLCKIHSLAFLLQSIILWVYTKFVYAWVCIHTDTHKYIHIYIINIHTHKNTYM